MQAWCWRKACSCLIHWRNSQELFNHVKKYYPCNAAKDRETYGGRLSKCWTVKLKGLGADIIYGPNFSSMSTTEISRRNTCLRGIWATCLYTYVSHVYMHTLESPWNLLPFFRKKERKKESSRKCVVRFHQQDRYHLPHVSELSALKPIKKTDAGTLYLRIQDNSRIWG